MEHQSQEAADRLQMLIAEHSAAERAATKLTQLREAAQHQPARSIKGSRHIPSYGYADAPSHVFTCQPHFFGGCIASNAIVKSA